MQVHRRQTRTDQAVCRSDSSDSDNRKRTDGSPRTASDLLWISRGTDQDDLGSICSTLLRKVFPIDDQEGIFRCGGKLSNDPYKVERDYMILVVLGILNTKVDLVSYLK